MVPNKISEAIVHHIVVEICQLWGAEPASGSSHVVECEAEGLDHCWEADLLLRVGESMLKPSLVKRESIHFEQQLFCEFRSAPGAPTVSDPDELKRSYRPER